MNIRQYYIRMRRKMPYRDWVSNVRFNVANGKRTHAAHGEIRKGTVKTSQSKYKGNGELK